MTDGDDVSDVDDVAQFQLGDGAGLTVAAVESLSRRIIRLDRGVGAVLLDDGGGGLQVTERPSGDDRNRFRTRLTALVSGLRGLDVPVVVSVDGPVYGSGLAIMLACDIRVGGARAVFEATADAGTWTPGLGWLLTAAVGGSAATRVLMADERIDATEAVRMGILTHRAAEATGRPARQVAAELIKRDAGYLSAGKRALRLSPELTFEEALSYESHLYDLDPA